jgi:hydroxymethylpyrimidine pyrophosphatase-like HAD family hydrolase
VRGIGYGYFGEHTVAVDRRLDVWTADLHGVVDGLAFRRWIGEERRLRALDAEGIAAYVAERRRALAVDEDPTPRFAGQDPVWEVAGNLLSAAFGRAWRLARVAGLDGALRRLLRAERPSVVDGSMSARHWFASEGGGLRKAAPDQRAFSNRNLGCYDAAFDVAGAAAGDHDGGERLHAAWRTRTGETISPERWLAYELVALWAERRDGAADAAQTERASARALQRYFSRLYLSDRPAAPAGPLVALDVDGVLETDALGYPSLSPASALALRALLAHGYRPVLATGRSLGEVRERCRAYGLAGGVAEYGSVLYDTATDRARSLVDDAGAAALARLRAALAALPGVHVGTDHEHAVRAWRIGSDGRTRALQAEHIEAALHAAGREHVRAVPGEGQTDFVAATVGKAQGLRALLGDEPLALAVGDAVEDVPMLALAQVGLAPANADTAMRASGHRRTRRPYQAGLAEAVGELVGHAPGACACCAAPADAPGRDVVLGVLAARERGGAHMAWRTARLLWKASRA